MKKKECVNDIYLLFGKNDMIVQIDADDFKTIDKHIAEEIRSIPNVTYTETLTCRKF